MAKDFSINSNINVNTEAAQRSIAALIASNEKLLKDNKSLSQSFSKMEAHLGTLKTAFAGVATAITGLFGLRSLADYAQKVNKQLYDMSRASNLTGISLNELSKGIDKLHDATRLSREESTAFFQTIQKGTVGIKTSASAVADLGQVLSNEFGPTLENVTDAFNTLSSIQQKNVHLFRVLQKSTDDAVLRRYTAGLVLTNDLSEEQLNVLTRTIRARADDGRGLTESEKKLIAQTNRMKELDKAVDDLKLAVGQGLIQAVQDLIPTIQGALQWMVKITESWGPEKLGRTVVLLGKIAAGFIAIKAAAKAIDIGKSVIGGAGSLLGGLRGGGGGGLLPSLGGAKGTPVYITGAAPGALGPLGGGAGMGGAGGTGILGQIAGRGMQAAPYALAGLAVSQLGGMGGEALKGAGHERAGAGLTAAGGIGGAALQGGAMGFALGGPWGAAIGAVGGAIIGVVQNFDDLKKSLSGVGDAISGVFATAMEFWDLSGAWDAVTETLSGVVDYVGGAFKSVWDEVGGFMEAIVPGWESLKSAMSSFMDSMMDMLGGVGDWIEEKAGKIGTLFGEGPLLGGLTEEQKAQEAKAAQVREALKGGNYTPAQALAISKKTREESPEAKASALKAEMETRNKLESEAGGNLEKMSAQISLAVNRLAEQKLVAGGMDKEEAKAQVARGGIAGFDAAAGISPEQIKKTLKDIAADPEIGEDLRKSIQDNLDKIDAKAVSFELAARGIEAFARYNKDIEATNSLIESINGNLASQAQYMAEYLGNAAGANQLLDQQAQNLKAQHDLAQQRLRMAAKTLDVDIDVNNVEGSRKKLMDDLLKLDQEGVDASDDRRASIVMALTALNKFKAEQVGYEKSLVDLGIQQINNSMVRANLMEQEASLMEAQMNLFTEMNLGLGPTLEMQTQLVDKLEQQKQQLQESLELTIKQIKENAKAGKDVIPLKQKALEIEQKITSATSKQVQLTKTLREGYLDAMQTFTNAEGTFSKMITSRQMGVAEMMRTLGAAGGARVGQLGAGGAAPVAQWGAGGSLQFRGDWNELNRQYGTFYNNPQMLQRNVSGAIQQGGASQFYGGQDKSVFSGGGGLTAAQAKRMGDLQTALIAKPEDQGLRKELEGLQAATAASDPLISAIKDVEKAIREVFSTSAQAGAAEVNAKANAEHQAKKDQDNNKKLAEEIQKSSKASAAQSLEKQNTATIQSAQDLQSRLEAADQADLKKWEGMLSNTDAMMAGVNTAMAGFGGGAGASGVLGTAQGARVGQTMNEASEKKYQQQLKERSDLQQKQYEIMKDGKVTWQEAELTAREQLESSKNVEKGTQDVVKAQNDGASRVSDSVNSAKSENAIVSAVCPIGRQTGGWVPGMGRGDIMPALLEPGEFVMNRRAAAMFAPLLESMNIGKFQSGGWAGLAPSPGLSGGGGGMGSPRFNISVRGDTKRNIMNNVNKQLGDILSDMMTTSGTTGRYYDLGRA